MRSRAIPLAAPAKINVVAIADLDFIGEQFFELRRRKIEDLEFDNVPFVLNCVDMLAGDESFVRLRRKRPTVGAVTFFSGTNQVIDGAAFHGFFE